MQKSEFSQGVFYALAAYILWGIAPLYFKAVDYVPADEILLHRIVWSCALLLVLVLLTGQVSAVKALLKQPRQVITLTFTAVLVAANWLLFIWAVNNDRLLEASLGYYINPLLNVALGMIFLGERLPKMQLVAVFIACFGVLIEVFHYGSVPWVSLLLAVSFGVYGLFKKKVKLQAVTGLFVETAILTPAALLYWYGLDSSTSSFSANTLNVNMMLIAAGVVTTLPLLAFSAAAVRIPFYMLGLFQYIGPSMMFAMAIFLYNEPLDQAKLTTFVFIWSALLLFTFDMWRQSKKKLAAKSVGKALD
ncbi:MAG: EamA family transporter RarD [Pseudomonadales bacterium]